MLELKSTGLLNRKVCSSFISSKFEVQIPRLSNILENFADSKEKIQKILAKKEIWPFPSKNDNLPEKDSQWKERLKQVEDAGYVLWRDPKPNQKWEMRDTKSKWNLTDHCQNETKITFLKIFP